MRRFLLACVSAAAVASAAEAQKVQVEVFTLENGMEFLLVPRKDQPLAIAAGWLARVGAVDERPGITGISHFFEHMMFKGTNTIGTKDAKRDAELRGKQKEVRDRLQKLILEENYQRWKLGEIEDPWDPKTFTPEMSALRAELTALEDQQKNETIVTNEFDRVYKNFGGSQMNAFTSEDVTFYFINVPSNKFELWAWMESDRLADSVFREFYKERDVVHEERRMRTESTPTGPYQEQFEAMFWMSSPYAWPVIGWPTDLNSYTMEAAQAYFDIYYRPNNLVGVIVGDFDPDYVKPTIQRYFGRLKRGETPPEPVITLEMPHKAEQRMYAECDCQPQVEVRYHTVPAMHKDSYALDIMAEVLNGRTGRLYKKLVEGEKIASNASAFAENRRFGGAFAFGAETKGDAKPEQLEAAWYAVLKDLQENPVGERELQKVKNRVAADSYRRLQSNFFLMIQLGYAEALGGWEEVNEAPAKLQAVTAADIQRVAKKYFARENRSVAIYTRKAGASAAAEDPELAALPAEAQGFVKQMVARLGAVDDPAKVAETIARMEGGMGQAPAEMRPAMEYLLKKAKERLEQLKSGGGQ